MYRGSDTTDLVGKANRMLALRRTARRARFTSVVTCRATLAVYSDTKKMSCRGETKGPRQ